MPRTARRSDGCPAPGRRRTAGLLPARDPCEQASAGRQEQSCGAPSRHRFADAETRGVATATFQSAAPAAALYFLPAPMRWEPVMAEDNQQPIDGRRQQFAQDRPLYLGTLVQFALRVVIVVFVAV